jgi:uncharacterized membrane protein YeaQ/YmgE (transglycosylase-associated protein family)
MGAFSDYRKALAPPWLRDAVGDRWHETLGEKEDALAARAKDAVKASFSPGAPADALWRIGADCRIERLGGESDAQYRTRLGQAFEIWERAGTARGMVEALRDAGFEAARLMTAKGESAAIVPGTGEFSLSMLDAGWSVRPTPDFWSAYHVLFPQPHPWACDGGIFEGTAGTMTPGGMPTREAGVIATIIAGGAGAVVDGVVGVELQIDSDSAVVAVPTHGVVDADAVSAGCGIKLTLAGSFQEGERFEYVTSIFPADDSATVNLLRRTVRHWQPAHATCGGIVVQTAGRHFGWPARTWGEAGVWGGAESHVWSL